MSTHDEALAHLSSLLVWWRMELDDVRSAGWVERCARPWDDRVAHGMLLTNMTFARREPKRSQDAFLWFRRVAGDALPPHRIRSGYPAVLWPDSDAPTDKAPHLARGAIVRITNSEVCVRFPSGYDRFVERGALHLEREASEVTYQRGVDAIRSLQGDVAAKRDRLLGMTTPRFAATTALRFRDDGLNEGQRDAVTRAASAMDALLIVGPPGTGKTRTLVEVVRQALAKRQRVLVTAASNVAVDNIARRLADGGVKVLRLGSGDVVSPDLAEHTLRAKMAALPEMVHAQAQFDAAHRLAAKGRPSPSASRRISELRRDAHASQDLARATVLRRSRVVCSTAGGVDAVPLGDEKFDLVVLDEATQAPDPVALAALLRGAVVVLAGDPQQLPPTVVTHDPVARAGLSHTLFERCSARWGDAATCMLTTQYRMSEELMRFPSAAHYQGRLEAGAANRHHRLQDLVPNHELDERDGRPWIFIDTSRLGHEELDEASTSYTHPEHAALVAAEIGRLLQSGVDIHDIAAICPYAAQVRRLRGQLEELVQCGLEIGTVDGFQGREKEVVVVDLVRHNAAGEVGFLADVRRTNVAITRAKRQLVVIADSATIGRHSYYRELIAAAKASGAWELAPVPS